MQTSSASSSSQHDHKSTSDHTADSSLLATPAASLLAEEAADSGQGFPSFNGSADTPDVTSQSSAVVPTVAQTKSSNAKPKTGTRKAALLVTGSTGISALIGIANGLISARLFGVSRAMDAYLVAVVIPQVLGFVFGIRLSVFLVPWLISLRHAHGARAARVMEWRIALLFPLVTALLLGTCYGLSGQVVHWLAPGFKPDEAALVIDLLKWTVPGGVAVVAMAILTSIAHSHQRFTGASLAGIINPLATFLFLVLLGRQLGVQTIAMGFFLGPLVGCLPIIWSLRGASSDELERRAEPDVPHFGMVFLLGLMTTAHNQLPLIISRNLASSMSAGVIAGLQYASTFSWMPVTILATSVGTALLPALAEKHNASKAGLDSVALHDSTRAIRVLAYLLVPLSFIMFFFSFPVVSLALSGGEFDKEAVLITSGAMQCYAPLIWIGAIWAILLKIVQARNALKVIFEALLLGTAVDVLVMVLLTSQIGYRAIPLAGAANYLVATLYVLCRTRAQVRLPLREITQSMLVLSALSFAASAVTWKVRDWTLAPLTGLVYAATYMGLAHLLKVREQEEFWTLILGRGLRRFRPSGKTSS
jgi:putative peptidoglycan lipid II flippase